MSTCFSPSFFLTTWPLCLRSAVALLLRHDNKLVPSADKALAGVVMSNSVTGLQELVKLAKCSMPPTACMHTRRRSREKQSALVRTSPPLVELVHADAPKGAAAAFVGANESQCAVSLVARCPCICESPPRNVRARLLFAPPSREVSSQSHNLLFKASLKSNSNGLQSHTIVSAFEIPLL